MRRVDRGPERVRIAAIPTLTELLRGRVDDMAATMLEISGSISYDRGVFKPGSYGQHFEQLG